MEIATVAAIFLIVGYFFLSLGAPLATLACAGTAYLLAVRVVAWVMQLMHVTLPPDVEPVLIVLLLGVTTDYSVFFMSGMRNRLAEGLPRLTAARLTTAEFAPIIVAAGILVAAGTGSLGVAHMQLIRAFGPALAVTVLTAMVVSMTLAPALIGIFGNALFWPGPRWLRKARHAAREAAAAQAAGEPAGKARRSPWRAGEQIAKLATFKPVALIIVAACVLVLLGAAAERDAAAAGRAAGHRAARQHAAGQGSGSGRSGVRGRHRVTDRGPGPAAGRGPRRDGPRAAPGRSRQATRRRRRHRSGHDTARPQRRRPCQRSAALVPNPMVAKSGAAARFGIIERTDPLGPTAVASIKALEARLPGLVKAAGLTGARIEVGGETAAIGEAISSTTSSLGELALIMLAITFVLLAIFLRALLAPLYLLAASVLALLATLGVTVWVFQVRLGYDGLVYYVPFTFAVLLISLGADYNVFVVGRIWEEARRRDLRDAIAVASSQSSRAIGVAGIALATSFALLALIPLQQFREVALAMAAGIVIDAIVARSLLVPALVALFGSAGMWPGRSPRRRRRQPPCSAGWQPG